VVIDAGIGITGRLLGGGIMAVLLVLVAISPSHAAKRPDVVLITMDTARADHFGCYGYALDTTPNIDRLAREGALFENAFAHAVNTNPSHASLFTGLLPVQHGNRYNGNMLREEVDTLATILSAAGYRTGAFVSGYTMREDRTAFARGFETYEDSFRSQTRPAVQTVDKALAWLESLPDKQRYFLFVHLFDPHGQYSPPPGFAERFRKGSYPPLKDTDFIPDWQRLRTGKGPYSKDLLEYISRYDGEIAYADQEIGRILERVGPDPLVIFTADHGETLLERYYFFDHGARLNEEQIRVPMIMRFPKRSLSRKRVEGMAQMTDVLPTILSFLKLSAPTPGPGKDLTSYIKKKKIAKGRRIFGEARPETARVKDRGYQLPKGTQLVSVRTERYKLIEYPTKPEPTFELFDLSEDPAETVNLAGEQRRRVEQMSGWIRAYRSLGDPAKMPELDEEAEKMLRSLGYID
jgi:arylsulfatase A-like enzyme